MYHIVINPSPEVPPSPPHSSIENSLIDKCTDCKRKFFKIQNLLLSLCECWRGRLWLSLESADDGLRGKLIDDVWFVKHVELGAGILSRKQHDGVLAWEGVSQGIREKKRMGTSWMVLEEGSGIQDLQNNEQFVCGCVLWGFTRPFTTTQQSFSVLCFATSAKVNSFIATPTNMCQPPPPAQKNSPTSCSRLGRRGGGLRLGCLR